MEKFDEIKRIDTIEKFNELIKNVESKEKDLKDKIDKGEKNLPIPFYRGQSNSEWTLSSSISRTKSEEPKITDLENPFKQLADIQHHKNQATRLIDYTTDVKVALYFACEKFANKDGALFITEYVPYSCNYEPVKELCLLSQINPNKSITLKEFIQYVYNNDLTPSEIEKKVSRLHSCIEYGFIVQPDEKFYSEIANNNKNMIKQKGCFYISGNKIDKSNYHPGKSVLYDYKPDIKITSQLESVSPILTSPIHTRKYIISSQIKEDILSNLKGSGINKNNLFPDKNNK